MDFCFLVKHGNKNFEVHILVVNPSEKELDELFSSRFNGADDLIASIPCSELEVAKIVLEYENQRLLLRYAVRIDSVPLIFRKAKDYGKIRKKIVAEVSVEGTCPPKGGQKSSNH